MGRWVAMLLQAVSAAGVVSNVMEFGAGAGKVLKMAENDMFSP